MNQTTGPRPPDLPPSAAEPLPGRTDRMVELAAIAGGLAHEIRNSLSTLRMNLQLLEEDWKSAESPPSVESRDTGEIARRSRNRIHGLLKESRRLESILEDFLQFVSKRELKIRPCDLNQLLSELGDFYRPQAEHHEIILSIEYAEGPLVCEIDVNLLKQAILNLMINAQQAMAGGGRLWIRLGEEGGRIDTGPGIPHDELSRIFEAYHSTKKSGTGLGLATTRRIIREHGGRIHVHSELKRGTCFSILLPKAG
ncbi:MAG: PAS domain-containing sensor histidine kinase [Phycisphaerae bacterium]